MKRFFAALILAALLSGGFCGCSKKETSKPTLKIVYLAGNVTSTCDVAGRENAITTRSIFGDSTKNYSWDTPLDPTVVTAANHDGTIQLAFSYTADDMTVYVSDPVTGETETVSGSTIEVEAGRSYSISIAGSWTSGTYIYDMEFAFDLVYTAPEASPEPEAPVIGTTPEPTPEQSPEQSAEPEPPVEQETKPEPAEEDKLFDSPPALIVSYNGETMEPSLGTTSWSYEKNGKMAGFQADSMHPMQWENIRTVERVYGQDIIELSFEYEPDEYSITIWNDDLMDFDVEDYESFFNTLEQEGKNLTLQDGAFEPETGYNTGYVVMVEAKWNMGQQDDTGYWGGSTIYAFAISPTNY